MSVSNRARSKRKRRSRSELESTGNTDRDLTSRPIRLILEGSERFADVLDPAKSLSEIESDVEEQVRSAVDHIVTLAAPYDAFDVLADVHLHEVLHDPETYSESEHEGLAATVEIVAMCVCARGKRPGSLPIAASGARPRPDAVIEEIVTVAHQLVDVGSMLGVVAALRTQTRELGSMALSSVMREVFLRNVAYPHMETDTITTLMTDPAVDRVCRAVMGCGGSDILTVFEASMSLTEAAWRARFEAVAELVGLETIKAPQRCSHPDDSHVPDWGDSKSSSEFERLLDRVWGNPGDTANHDVDTVAAMANVAPDVVAIVRELTSTDVTSAEPLDAVLRFLRGDNPFRLRPILRAADGSTTLIHSGLLVPAVRSITEAHLKNTPGWDTYAKRRGELVEEQAVRLLLAILPMATVHRGYEYFVPDPNAATPQTTPASFTKIVEGDALLVVDDVAVVIEAKSGSLSPASRRGDPRRLSADLHRILTSASEQADRTRERILADGGLRLRDQTWLDLRNVREVHTIAVSLDDLTGIATVTSQLVETGILRGDRLPWTVSLHDLRIVSELVERPAELILYLRRRTDAELTIVFVAQDELDLFLHFLAGQLYVEPDPEEVERQLPQFRAAGGTRMRRRRKRQPTTLIQSRTDPLDAWYAYELGQRSTPAPKPQLACDPRVAELVDAIAARADAGWLSIGATLFDGNAALQRNFGRFGPDVVRNTRADGERHSVTDMGGHRAEWSYIGVWASIDPRGSLDRDADSIADYVMLKKHQMQAARGFGLLFDLEGRLVATAYDNRLAGPDPHLDGRVAAAGFRPATGALTAYPPSGRSKSSRVTPKKAGPQSRSRRPRT